MAEVKLEVSWKKRLVEEFEKDYMKSLRAFLQAEKQAGKVIYPQGSEYFKAFELTPFDQVKVVILGQDPYHGPDQAHGLCFSVRQAIKTPPSLVNMYKELEQDLGISPANHGNLEHWGKQGVLLLNSVLTVEQGKAASHQGRGWEQFTDEVIARLNAERQGIVFILWGSYAQRKGSFIDTQKHMVIKSVHPSPLSAHRGFFGSRPFSKTNAYLQQQGLPPIDWQLPTL
ncbi:uracil-DNA glycosylase [Endozoicomonas sp. SM1973]|uniref:Uracil-DNA glycosylase n=1 Tax=Spartinivicinus marinus TaxID=2994442 RepID=A0A853I6R6_9GAMM|nr:uracil-DNA glycosylase [Spartinivicinus marinus]MCX4025514.1 uracil-DNA glycosylase [Spartinivicinus marinus]NYZ65257.1 uracil-DNA glycosylase [Spartinivicinus marinus]